MIFFYLISGLFLGWSFGAKDTANIFGSAVETKMIRFKTAALLAAIFVTLGALLEGGGPSATFTKLGAVNEIGGAFTVALAAAATITLTVKLGIPVSTSQTIAGAIIGWNFFAGRLTEFSSVAIIISSGILAPVMGGICAATLFYIFRASINRSRMHLMEQDYWTRFWLVIIGAFGAYSLGANNIANIVGVFIPVNPFRDVQIPFVGTLSALSQLFLLGSASIIVGIYTYSHKIMKIVGKDLFNLSPITGLIAVLSESIVLFLFSSQALHNLALKLGLPPIPLVPVSASQIIVGCVLGIGLAKGGKNIRYQLLGKISFGWVAAPLIAFLLSFLTLFIFQNVFEMPVRQPSYFVFNRTTLTEIDRRGYDIEKLSTVNGRTFENERELFHELHEGSDYTRKSLLALIRITEKSPLEIHTALIYKNGQQKHFNQAQFTALRKLEGKTYEYRWQLRNALSEDPAWQYVDTNRLERDKARNKELDNEFDILYSTFVAPPEK